MMLERIKRLTEAFGAPSGEGEVRALIAAELSALGLTTEIDRMGNLSAHIKGTAGEHATRATVFAHMDEAGLMLTEVDEDGFFRFSPLGRLDTRVLSGRFVTLAGKNGRVKGLIAAKGIHLQDRKERRRVPERDDLYLDIGAADKAGAEEQVSLGDLAVFDTPLVEFGKNNAFLCGKALDGRIGCAVLLDAAEKLVQTPASADVTLLFLARATAVPAGAATALAQHNPEIAICVDALPANDLADKPRGAVPGCGVLLPFTDGRTLYDRDLHATVRALAEELSLTVTVPTGDPAVTDAAELHRAGVGMRSICLAYPVRAPKSPTEIAAKEDIVTLEALLTALLARI